VIRVKALWIAFIASILAAVGDVAVAVKFDLEGDGTFFILVGLLLLAILFSSLATRKSG